MNPSQPQKRPLPDHVDRSPAARSKASSIMTEESIAEQLEALKFWKANQTLPPVPIAPTPVPTSPTGNVSPTQRTNRTNQQNPDLYREPPAYSNTATTSNNSHNKTLFQEKGREIKWQLPFRSGSTLAVKSFHTIPSQQSISPPVLPKLAMFDLDATIIMPKDGKQFPSDEDDWVFTSNQVPVILRKLHDNGWELVFFTNQARATSSEALKRIRNKCDNIINALGLPISVYISTGRDMFRKPSRNTFDLCLDQYHKLLTLACPTHKITQAISHSHSFYVGDAAGRSKSSKIATFDKFKKSACKCDGSRPEPTWPLHLIQSDDHSSVDYAFAMNIFGPSENQSSGFTRHQSQSQDLPLCSNFYVPELFFNNPIPLSRSNKGNHCQKCSALPNDHLFVPSPLFTKLFKYSLQYSSPIQILLSLEPKLLQTNTNITDSDDIYDDFPRQIQPPSKWSSATNSQQLLNLDASTHSLSILPIDITTTAFWNATHDEKGPIAKPQLLILAGLPGSSKTTFSLQLMSYLQSTSSVISATRVNRDTMLQDQSTAYQATQGATTVLIPPKAKHATVEQCQQRIRSAFVGTGGSTSWVINDNTNLSMKNNIAWYLQNFSKSVSTHLIYFDIPVELSFHLNCTRASMSMSSKGVIPFSAYNDLLSQLDVDKITPENAGKLGFKSVTRLRSPFVSFPTNSKTTFIPAPIPPLPLNFSAVAYLGHDFNSNQPNHNSNPSKVDEDYTLYPSDRLLKTLGPISAARRFHDYFLQYYDRSGKGK